MIKTYYTADHEWLTIENNVATIGITDHAQQALGEIVFVELPTIGETFEKAGPMSVVESVKSASDIYAPITGTIIEVNQVLEDAPETVNESPENEGWFIKMTFDGEIDTSELMSCEDYVDSLEG